MAEAICSPTKGCRPGRRSDQPEGGGQSVLRRGSRQVAPRDRRPPSDRGTVGADGTGDLHHRADIIEDVIAARIDRLPEEGKRALQVASVIGREVHRSASGNRLEQSKAGTHALLQELTAVELVREKSLFPELAYMLCHALTHDVAYGSLLLQRRRGVAPARRARGRGPVRRPPRRALRGPCTPLQPGRGRAGRLDYLAQERAEGSRRLCPSRGAGALRRSAGGCRSAGRRRATFDADADTRSPVRSPLRHRRVSCREDATRLLALARKAGDSAEPNRAPCSRAPTRRCGWRSSTSRWPRRRRR